MTVSNAEGGGGRLRLGVRYLMPRIFEDLTANAWYRPIGVVTELAKLGHRRRSTVRSPDDPRPRPESCCRPHAHGQRPADLRYNAHARGPAG
jgi:hypothetical protein